METIEQAEHIAEEYVNEILIESKESAEKCGCRNCRLQHNNLVRSYGEEFKRFLID